MNGCGNSFYLSLPGVRKTKVILGGDCTYDALHWITLGNAGKPDALKLTKGTMTFTLISKESGIMIDQFLLTTDARYKPAGAYSPTAGLLAK